MARTKLHPSLSAKRKKPTPGVKVPGFSAIANLEINVNVLNNQVMDRDKEKSDYSLTNERSNLTNERSIAKFDRAVMLLRSLATGDGKHIWTAEDSNILTKSILPLRSEPAAEDHLIFSRLRTAVFKGLEPGEILKLLNELLRVYYHSFDFGKRFIRARNEILMDIRSIRAMSVDHLQQVKKWLFDDSVDEMLSLAYEGQTLINPIETIRYIIEDRDKRDFFFESGAPFDLVSKMMCMHHTPSSIDFLADSITGLIDTNGVISDAVQEMLFKKISNRYMFEHTRSALLNRVYAGGKVPPAESWTVLLFDQSLCHEWIDGDIYGHIPEPDEGQPFLETPFCKDCHVDLVRTEAGAVSCQCKGKLKLDVCDFLLRKRVEIPSSFWRKVAYYNLHHLAHYLHTNKPHGFITQIDSGSVHQMIKSNSTGLAQFMVQYYGPIEVPRDIRMTTKMERILRPNTSEHRSSHLMECQKYLDDNAQNIPENFYLHMCNLFKKSYLSARASPTQELTAQESQEMAEQMAADVLDL